MNQFIFYFAFSSAFVPVDARPQIWEATRFPSRQACEANLHFNWEYQYKLRERQTMYMTGYYDPRWWNIKLALDEAAELRTVWEKLESIQRNREWSNQWMDNWQRNSLQEFKEKIGEENFYNGWMPPVVPIWRFREVE